MRATELASPPETQAVSARPRTFSGPAPTWYEPTTCAVAALMRIARLGAVLGDDYRRAHNRRAVGDGTSSETSISCWDGAYRTTLEFSKSVSHNLSPSAARA